MPKAWTTDLDEIAQCRTDDAAQATFALTLQAATMAAQVVRDCEMKPSVARHKADLEAARLGRGELIARHKADLEAARKAGEEIVSKSKVIEEDLAAEVKQAEMSAKLAREEVARMRSELERTRTTRDVALRGEASQKAKADQLADELLVARREVVDLAARHKEACQAANNLGAATEDRIRPSAKCG